MKEELLGIANRFIIDLNNRRVSNTPFQYTFSEEYIEYCDRWFFALKIVTKEGVDFGGRTGFGGAPGFTITKGNLEVKTVAWHEWHSIKSREERRTKLFEAVEKIRLEDWNYHTIRVLTNMRPIQILEFKKSFKTLDYSLAANRSEVVDFLETVISQEE